MTNYEDDNVLRQCEKINYEQYPRSSPSGEGNSSSASQELPAF
jgi:hypothetical protein